MGILSSAGINNGLTDFLAAHRGALTQFGTGLASGPTLAQGIALGTQGLAQGAQQDTAYATSQKVEKQRQDEINATSKYLQSNPAFADLVPLVAAGQSGPALQEAFSRLKGNAPKDLMHLNPNDVVYDPNTKQSVFTAPPAPAATPGETLSPDALDLIASQYLAGDKTVISGYARNANMKALIANKIAEKANAAGMDGPAIAAEVSAYGGNVAAQRSAGTRAAQVGMAASEANQMADIALEASKAVPRGNFVPWNAAVNAVSTNTSSPEMAQFVTATTSLVNAYARAVSPLGAPTDAMRQHAEQMLNTAQGPEAYAAVISQMKKEMEAALNAPAEISKRLKESITGGGETTPGAGQKTSTGVNWSYTP